MNLPEQPESEGRWCGMCGHRVKNHSLRTGACCHHGCECVRGRHDPRSPTQQQIESESIQGAMSMVRACLFGNSSTLSGAIKDEPTRLLIADKVNRLDSAVDAQIEELTRERDSERTHSRAVKRVDQQEHIRHGLQVVLSFGSLEDADAAARFFKDVTDG